MAGVNFEDLFDFSPQGEAPDGEDLDTYVERTAESLFRTSATLKPTFVESSQFKLSASLPTALSAR